MVAVLKATGGDEATQEMIAQRVGLSVPTLTKYYFRELEGGPALARQALIGVMWRKAMVGNVGAARWIDDKLSKGELDEFLARTGASATPCAAGATRSPNPKEPPAGKKAQANEAAQTAHEGTEWGNLLRH
jgi:hypothetical protein